MEIIEHDDCFALQFHAYPETRETQFELTMPDPTALSAGELDLALCCHRVRKKRNDSFKVHAVLLHKTCLEGRGTDGVAELIEALNEIRWYVLPHNVMNKKLPEILHAWDVDAGWSAYATVRGPVTESIRHQRRRLDAG